jgi:RNA polymerase sigma-70 factor (ECF subfamily)
MPSRSAVLPFPSQRSGADDLALRQRFAQGEAAALAELARPHLDLLYTHCLRMMGSPTDAEDLAQEALCRALRQHQRYDPQRPFRPWLLALSTNLCRDQLRTVWWRRVFSLDMAISCPRGGPEERAEEQDRDRRVRHALSTLPTAYREALSLFHLESMSYQEMADITGDSVPALKQRVHRGSEMLHAAMRRLYPELVIGRTQGDD